MYYFAEDLLVMIMRSKENTEDKTQAAQYELEITEERIFPKAYDECQAILKKFCLEDPFLCGMYYILPIHISTSYGTI